MAGPVPAIHVFPRVTPSCLVMAGLIPAIHVFVTPTFSLIRHPGDRLSRGRIGDPMTTRSKYRTGIETFYEDLTYETVFPMAPLLFGDDFIGAGHQAGVPAAGSPVAGYPWVKKIVGSAPPTVALISNAQGGQIQLALAATNEAEDCVLYWNDNLSVDVTRVATWEARAALTVPPSAAGVQMVMGLAGPWTSGPQNNPHYIWFNCQANNSLLLGSQDGTNQYSIAAANPAGAVTLDTNFHTFRISAENPADIAFYVDGVRVNAANSMPFVAITPNSILQPYMAVYKTASTGLATLVVDKVDLWSNR